MRFSRFRDWGIFQKVMSISIIFNTLMIVWAFFYLMPLIEQKLMDEKRNASKDVLDIAYTLVAAHYQEVTRGALTTAQAQKNALSLIGQLRYRDDDYFWINDLEPKMLMHPMFSNLEGKNLSKERDPNGKHLFVEMVGIVQARNEGFINYMWPKPGKTTPVAKLSFVRLFKPWGWIIGSGIYVDDVQEEIASMKLKIIIATLICVAIVLIIAYFVAHRISELWKWFSYSSPEK